MPDTDKDTELFARSVELIERLCRETERLRSDVRRLAGRIEPFDGEIEPTATGYYQKSRNFREVINLIEETRRCILERRPFVVNRRGIPKAAGF